jgi:uncharacterized protein involved in outer membrane biogenesis
MHDPHPSTGSRLATAREKAARLYRSHRARKTALIVAVVLVVFGLLGFFAAPPIIKSQLQTRLTAMLGRPVSVGTVHLDPYTLRLQLDRVHIPDRDGRAPFVDVDQVVINASWTSLFRMAPILDALSLQHPQLRLARTAPQQFNFSDILARLRSEPSKPDDKPARFSVSNISVHDGDIRFDDAVTHAAHRIDHLELGIPFIANLPHDTDVFVQPLLAMNVDGSPLRITGDTKPFAQSRESTMAFSLNRLDLPRYLGYVPEPLPVAIKRGQLSGQLQLRFAQTTAGPQVRLDGQLRLDDLALATPTGDRILEAQSASATLDDVEPLLSRYRLGAVQLDGLNFHYTLQAGGHSNLDTLLSEGKPAAAPGAPTDLRIATLTLQNGSFEYLDARGGQAALLAMENIHGSVRGLSLLAAPAATVNVTAQFNGGSAGLDGKLDLAKSRYDGKLALKGVALAPLLSLAPPLLNVDSGKGTLDLDGQLQADWHKSFDVTLQPARAAINDLALTRNGRTPVAWQSLQAGITRFDLASSTAQLDQLTLHGLQVDARRLHDGGIDLAGLVKSAPSTGKSKASPEWHWSIAHIGIDDGAFALTDPRLRGRRGHVVLKVDKFGIDGVSDDLHKPVKLDLAGGIGRGSFRVDGSVRPQPLDADLRVHASRLDVAPLQSLVSVPLNVTLDNALLSADGRASYRAHDPQPLLGYRGRMTLSRVRVQDKLTGEDFLRWNTMSVRGLDVRMGEDVPHVSADGLALNDFYARVIINANGRLNIQDVVANPASAPVSVTEAQKTPVAQAAAPAPQASVAQATPAPAGTAATPRADIRIGGITLAHGHLNYTDDFIKPNYTADITELEGKIGALSSAGGHPADVNLQGQLDGNSPVNITGAINPLAPVAFLDVKGNAEGVELTHLSPYSDKYAGYPITSGRLTMDVHYMLDNGKLNADNHIFIEQLTFGDPVKGPGIKHLPVKLAVALLKNSQGQIDVHVPVSGSLDDPRFSVGSLVWHAFLNLITRAVTSPFRLIASAFGGAGGKQQDLGYVAFAPGSAVLDAAAQAKLAQIVKVLQQKTSLKLQIIGRVDPKFDVSGLRKVTVDQMVQSEAGDDVDITKLSTDKYDKYLKKVYRHAKFDKPRNLIGMTKSEPPDVMRKALEAHVPADADALRHLAERRADAVRGWLRGKLDDKRVFVQAPKLDAKGIDDAGKTTRVEFGLQL